MAVSLNSVIGFNSTLQAKLRHDSRSPAMSFSSSPNSLATFRSTSKLQRLIPSVADSDRLVTTDTNEKSNSNELNPVSNEQLKASSEEGEPQTAAPPQSRPKRSPPLTARERLKAARVFSRYTETKPSKRDMGKKVLDALMKSDKGGTKRSRLPEAPADMMDDEKRGMPNPGWTFDFPGGSDLLVIAFSFVFISTVMFATTFIVWKVGAIHFNEY